MADKDRNIQHYTAGNGTLFRWVQQTGPVHMLLQRWNGKEWISWPDLIAASGIGGDTSYEEIDEEEAQRLKDQLTGEVE